MGENSSVGAVLWWLCDLLDGVFQGLSGLEGGHLRRGDLDGLAGVGVAALTGGPFPHLKGTKADELHAVTGLQRVRHNCGAGVQRRLRVLLRQAGLFRNRGNKFVLVPLNSPFSVDCRMIPYLAFLCKFFLAPLGFACPQGCGRQS